MPPSERALLGVVLAANLALYAVALLPPPADRDAVPWSDQYRVWNGTLRGSASHAITLNAGYLRWFFDGLRDRRRVLLVGTSETDVSDNLPCQFNALDPAFPWARLAKGGLSPIHASVLFARAAAMDLELPPLIYVVNPIYFTRSHNVIDEGWLSAVARTPGFLIHDDWDLEKHMTTEAFGRLRNHLARHRRLLPVTLQAHLGHRIYLATNLAPADVRFPDTPPEVCDPPEAARYDRERNVHVGYEASDRYFPDRWRMQPEEDSINLVGLRNLLHTLAGSRAPVLVLLLPPNRTFYAAAGLDMDEWDRRWEAHRHAIAGMVHEGEGGRRVFLVDIGRALDLEGGYRDRMHPDANGNLRMARHLVSNPRYREFERAVAAFYEKDRVSDAESVWSRSASIVDNGTPCRGSSE